MGREIKEGNRLVKFRLGDVSRFYLNKIAAFCCLLSSLSTDCVGANFELALNN